MSKIATLGPQTTARDRLVIGVIILGIVASLVVVFPLCGNDDPYITFRYTRNVLQGDGLVYNAGERVLSTTTPGYAFLLAGVGLLYRNLPLLGNLFSALGLGLGAAFLYLWSEATGQRFVGWTAGLLLLTFPLLASTFGSEMCLYIGLLLGGLYCHVRERPVLAMALLGVATLFRPSGVLGAGLVALHLLYKQRRFPWKPVVAYTLVLLPWLVYGTLFYGSPVPVTLSAKQAQGRMAISDSFAWRAWKMLRSYLKNPFYWSFVPLGVLGVWQIAIRRQKWLILLAWTGCYAIGYVALDVSGYYWYYAPLVPGVIVSVAVGLDWVRERLAAWLPRRTWQWVIVIPILVTMVWPNVQGLYYIFTHPDTRVSIYRRVGQWIDSNLPANASVGTLEVGIIGYYAQQRLVDFAGLIQPQVAGQMHRETTYQDTALWAVQQYHPDYLVLGSRWFPGWQDTVLGSCAEVQSFTDQIHPDELIIYECEWQE